jgi:hypothetical protein
MGPEGGTPKKASGKGKDYLYSQDSQAIEPKQKEAGFRLTGGSLSI